MKRSIQLSVLLLVTALLLIQCNVLWLPPKKYHPVNRVTLAPPVMTLEEYTSSGLISRHPRPYVYTIERRNTRGAVLVFGAEHTFDPNHKQFPARKENWDRFNATTALVEGNLDLILTWFFNPVKASGEGGYTQKLAKSKGIKIYTWEPGIEAEMDAILEKYDPFHVAVFYCLRPYQNRWDQFSKAGQDSKMAHLIADRAQYKTLRGTLTSVEQVDSLWKADFPSLPSWRSYKHPANGWPDGMLKQIAEETNMVRDVNMCRAIIELVNKGERVFISMGASHAPRIEGTLRGMIQ